MKQYKELYLHFWLRVIAVYLVCFGLGVWIFVHTPSPYLRVGGLAVAISGTISWYLKYRQSRKK